jgi:hypothetical protein
MLVTLCLQAGTQFVEDRIQLFPKKASCAKLIAAIQYTGPQQVKVIRHAAVDGAAKAVTERRVGQDLPEFVVVLLFPLTLLDARHFGDNPSGE